MTKVFDVDALAAEFEPVCIRFRGEEYVLGDTVESVLAATKIAESLPDDAPTEEQLALLPKVLRALNKKLGKAVAESEPSLPERLVFQKAVTELMTRVGNVPFRPSE